MSHGEGYGLGLTASKIILDAHHGTIKADNYDEGAVFEISFEV